jgi:hypothetical protein
VDLVDLVDLGKPTIDPADQILRSSDPQILRSTDPQILNSSNPQILKSQIP